MVIIAIDKARVTNREKRIGAKITNPYTRACVERIVAMDLNPAASVIDAGG